MAKKTITPQHLTREILKVEISASEQRLGEKIAGIDVKADNVEKRLNVKIDNIEKRLEAKIIGLDQKIIGLDQKIIGLDQKIIGLDQKIIGLDQKITGLDGKVDTTTLSLKEYTDSRFNQLDAKLTKYFELMMQAFSDGNKAINKVLSSHEERITVLEGRGPQPGRI
jgi:hypothetical protein